MSYLSLLCRDTVCHMSQFVTRYVLGPISHLGHETIIPIPLLRVPRPIPWVWPPLPLFVYLAPDLVLNGTLGVTIVISV